MALVLWFIAGLLLAAAISYGVVHLYRLRSSKEAPLPPDKLPKDWDSVMPREKPKEQRKAGTASEPSFRKVGVKKGTGNGSSNRR